ncbi:hypothetical protein BG842_04915 [Haladaptatus sp. W1]|uniref:hypothetical protein n=1 Tax=Haladaptatus sp. W1 TaxID=1897478 RepID=UPI000849EB23|nr:hypothetical protein [Haladaptatus sp. W1]ODR79855.1 hypothetical protein BG842_04915 [Haladaptatus sp. W1]
MSETIVSTSEHTPSDKWWILIAVLAVLVPIIALLGAAFPPDVYTSLTVAPFGLLAWILAFLSPLIVYFDKQYVTAVSDWTPSGWYYLMIAPPLTLVLPFVYLYERHKYVGTP